MSIKNSSVIDALRAADSLFLPSFIFDKKFITGEPKSYITHANSIQTRMSLK